MERKNTNVIRTVLLLIFLVICFGLSFVTQAVAEQDSSRCPPPFTMSEHFKTLMVYFEIDPEIKGIKCIIRLEIIKQFEKQVFAELKIKNPKLNKMPLVANQTIKPDGRIIQMPSPIIQGFQEGIDYDVTVLVYEDELKTQLITTHTQRAHPEFGFLVDKRAIGIMYAFEGNIEKAKERFKLFLEDYGSEFRSESALEVLDAFEKGLVNKEYVDYFFKGLAYDIDRKFDKAIPEFQKAAEINSNCPQAFCFLGNDYVFLGKYKEAMPFFEKCINLKPDSPEAYWGMATYYGSVNESQKEKEYLQKAKELFQQTGDTSALEFIEKRIEQLSK